MRVLIAEDDRISRMILTEMVKKWGYDPVAVEDGQQAWDVMQEPDAPHLALLDWEMPGMSGLEVCRRIRDGNPSHPPYLILLTARNDKADIVTGLDSGANDYISKPYDNRELQARLQVGRRMVDLQTELLDAKDALAHEAMHDALTGALNRRAVFEGLSREMSRAVRRQTGLSIGMCDIDHFKQVNDTYGHQTGDAVLCALVAAMKTSLRRYDLVGRYGGEEFLVVAPGSEGSAREGIYERLRYLIEDLTITTPCGRVNVTMSMGVAKAAKGQTMDALLAAADAALYRAKAQGRNRVVYDTDPRAVTGDGRGKKPLEGSEHWKNP